ncbi:hypothetical protein C0991_003011, partial [Blastosporella zonata]
MFSKLCLALVIGSGLLRGEARQLHKADVHARQATAAKRFQNTFPVKRTVPLNITFSNPKASGTSSAHTPRNIRLTGTRVQSFTLTEPASP